MMLPAGFYVEPGAFTWPTQCNSDGGVVRYRVLVPRVLVRSSDPESPYLEPVDFPDTPWGCPLRMEFEVCSSPRLGPFAA